MNTFIRPQIPVLLLRVQLCLAILVLALTLTSCDPTGATGPVTHHVTKEYKWLTPRLLQLSASMPGTDYSIQNLLVPTFDNSIQLDTNRGDEMTVLLRLDSLPIGMYIGESYGSGSNSTKAGVSTHLMSLSMNLDTLRFKRDSLGNFSFGLNRHDNTKRCFITTAELDSATNTLTPTHHYADGVETRVMGYAYIDAENPNMLHLIMYYFLSGTAVPSEPQLVINLVSEF
jgi:hypothetical protein